MGYIDENLMTGEQIMYRTTLHWVVFIWSGFFLIIGIGFLFTEFFVIGILCIIIAALLGLKSFIKYKTSEFGVSNKRVLVKTGWIKRSAAA